MMRLAMSMVIGLVLVACTTPESRVEPVGGERPVSAVVDRESVSADHTITVSGSGEVKGIPDTLVVDLGVSLVRPDISTASADAAALATAVIEALVDRGVARQDIQTINYSVYPEYRYTNEEERLIGFRVSNTVRARIGDIESAGGTIDAAVAAGGDEIVVSGVSFDIEQNQELLVAAREAAWNDAKAKAEQLAGLAGVELGQVVSISESVSQAPPVYMEFSRMTSNLDTPIEPGRQTVSIVLEVVFAIE